MKSEEYKSLFELEDHFWWFVGMRKITAALLDPLVKSKNLRVLDAGCGTGTMLSWLKRYARGGEVVGVDLSKEALDFARRRGHQPLIQVSVAELPLASNAFDLVTSFEVLDSFSPERVSAAFSELARVLKPGGILFIRLPAFQSLYSGHDRAVSTVHRYSLQELAQKFKEQGLMPMRLSYANTLLLPVAVIWRWLHREPHSDVRPLPRGLVWTNAWLARILSLEAAWLRLTRLRLPVGLSVIGMARKTQATP
jgi:SAM-dependent methyltransferase